MKKCPICGEKYERLLALSRRDNTTMICDRCGMMEALDDYGKYRLSAPQERTKAAVYATGNKWAIENFEATHN